MAVLFMVTGRESEATRSKHPNECAQYREDSVGYFRVYATRFKKYLPHFDILLAALSAAIKNLCHDAFLADPSASPEAKNFCIVLSFIHELDLPRCEASVFEKIMKKRKALVIIGNEQGEALEKLIDYAKACIMTSGDRLIGERDYDSERFFRLSQDTVLGYQILNAVPKPELASPSASKSEESEESESELENPLFASPQMH
jgi:hypothetical protein